MTKQMTLKRFKDNFSIDYKSHYEVSSNQYKGYIVSMSISPFDGSYKYTTEFYKWVEDKNPQKSGNRLIFKSKNYDEVLKFKEKIENEKEQLNAAKNRFNRNNVTEFE